MICAMKTRRNRREILDGGRESSQPKARNRLAGRLGAETQRVMRMRKRFVGNQSKSTSSEKIYWFILQKYKGRRPSEKRWRLLFASRARKLFPSTSQADSRTRTRKGNSFGWKVKNGNDARGQNTKEKAWKLGIWGRGPFSALFACFLYPARIHLVCNIEPIMRSVKGNELY